MLTVLCSQKDEKLNSIFELFIPYWFKNKPTKIKKKTKQNKKQKNGMKPTRRGIGGEGRGLFAVK